jgi:hypothetical protein
MGTRLGRRSKGSWRGERRERTWMWISLRGRGLGSMGIMMVSSNVQNSVNEAY